MEARHAAGDDETPWPAPEPGVEITGRLGPAPMENDSWDEDTWDDVLTDEAIVDDDERYHGRRRVSRTSALHRWIAVSAALVALAATVAIISAPSRGSGGGMSLPTVPSNADDSAPGATPPASAASTTITATGAPSTQPRTSSGDSDDPGGAPPFAAITVEAEVGSPATVLTGSAQITPDERASGGQIVTGLGDWGAEAAGTLKFTGVAIPSAGSYRITAYFSNQGAPGPRTAVIGVTGAKPVSVTFTGGPNCCGTRSVEVTLAAGTHAITISNPSGRAPSVDKIVVSRV